MQMPTKDTVAWEMSGDLSVHSYHLKADFVQHSSAQRMKSVLVPYETTQDG